MNYNITINPMSHPAMQNDSQVITFSTTGYTISNTTHSVQIRNPEGQIRGFTDLFQNTNDFLFPPPGANNNLLFNSFYSPFFTDPRVTTQNQNASMWSMSQQNAGGTMTSFISGPGYYSQHTVAAEPGVSINLEPAFELFNIFFNENSTESRQNQGLTREQLNELKTVIYEEKKEQKEVPSRIKTRNGISKQPKCQTKNSTTGTIVVSSTKDSEPTSNETCAICIGDYSHGDKLTNLPCSHKFHKDCVDEWLVVKNSCPVCKGKVLEAIQPTPTRESNIFRTSNLNNLFDFANIQTLNDGITRLTHDLGVEQPTIPAPSMMFNYINGNQNRQAHRQLPNLSAPANPSRRSRRSVNTMSTANNSNGANGGNKGKTAGRKNK